MAMRKRSYSNDEVTMYTKNIDTTNIQDSYVPKSHNSVNVSEHEDASTGVNTTNYKRCSSMNKVCKDF
jgi:hypothetical protein